MTALILQLFCRCCAVLSCHPLVLMQYTHILYAHDISGPCAKQRPPSPCVTFTQKRHSHADKQKEHDRVARRLVKYNGLEDSIKVTPGDDWKNVNLMHTNLAQASYGQCMRAFPRNMGIPPYMLQQSNLTLCMSHKGLKGPYVIGVARHQPQHSPTS